MTANSNSHSDAAAQDDETTTDRDYQHGAGRTDGVHPDNKMTDRHRPPPSDSGATWTTGEKYGVGTACDHGSTDESRVWFTLTEGAATELRFPRADLMNVRSVDVLVADPETGYSARTHNERGTDDAGDTLTRSATICEDEALVFQHEITETADRSWELTAEYCTDPAADSLAIDLTFEATDEHSYDLYVVAETAPSGYVDNTIGERLPDGDGFALAAREARGSESAIRNEAGEPYAIATAVAATDPFEWLTMGGPDSDHIDRLRENGEQTESQTGMPAESSVLIGLLGSDTSTISETLAVGFAREADVDAAHEEARATLDRGYEQVRRSYVSGWQSYLDSCPVPEAVSDDPELETQYRTAVMVLKAVESKAFPAASIASPSVPWGDNVDATDPRDYGYNYTWARDLYQVATAQSALGDRESVRAAVEYLFETQQRPDGSFPQNTHLDGRIRWGGEQLDNVGFPAVLAYQLDRRHDGLADSSVGYDDIRRSCEYILRSGPATQQERWEEESGYSPSTIAAQVAGLACASVLADEAGERADALAYLAHADWWRLAVDDWCATDAGTATYEQTPYYVRITADGKPDDQSERSLANDGPALDERNILDAGFLELVRLGLRDPTEPVVENSVAAVDEAIRVDTPGGPAWYRYPGDAYGELGADESDEGGPWSMDGGGRGRLWPILTGERGEYELIRGTEDGPLAPQRLLETMASFANSGRMLPEQVWDRPEPTRFGWEFGAGTGSATPLAWSMAQFVRLAHSIDAGHPIETPQFLLDRYQHGTLSEPALTIEQETNSTGTVTITGETDGNEVVIWTPSESRFVDASGGRFEFELPADCQQGAVIAATDADDLAAIGTTIERFER